VKVYEEVYRHQPNHGKQEVLVEEGNKTKKGIKGKENHPKTVN